VRGFMDEYENVYYYLLGKGLANVCQYTDSKLVCALVPITDEIHCLQIFIFEGAFKVSVVVPFPVLLALEAREFSSIGLSRV
jgi:hypothetical protein